jgi:NitT/TauT family transport system permease protein
LPGASAFIFAGLRVGVEMSFFMLVAAEMVGATDGLGWLLHNSAMNYQIGRIYAASLVIVLMSFGLSVLLKFLQNRLFFWREGALDSMYAEGGVKRNALKKWQACAVAAFVVTLLTVGTWQVEVSRQKMAGFNRTIHVHEHHPTPQGAAGH